MRFVFPILLITLLLPVGLQAQSYKEPKPPQSLDSLVAQGAQLFYMGQFENMHGWVLIRQGKPEFFYENKERTAMVMGLMFNGDGNMVTMSQLNALKEERGDELYATTGTLQDRIAAAAAENAARTPAPAQEDLATPIPAVEEAETEVAQPATEAPQPQSTAETPPSAAPTESELLETPGELATPLVGRMPTAAEKMYADLITANWITMNPTGERDMFAFIDPDCSHCRVFIDSSEEFLKRGSLRLRVIPVGVTAESARRAAVLLASANPEERLKNYVAGDEAALPAPETINTDAISKNLRLLAKHNLNVTPVIAYKTDQGKIRLIRGRPNDYNQVLRDITEN